jgi:ArsR family transcriptional regulator
MDLKKVEKISKALSDPSRILILKEISKKKACLYCTEISDIVDLAQPSISHHVKQLIDADLISSSKEGRAVKYALNTKVLDEYTEFLKSLQL